MKCQRRTDVSYGNPIIARIERAKADAKHLGAIRNMQPSIDNAPPVPMPHLTTFGRDYFAKKKATTEAAFADLKMIQSIAKTMTRPFELPAHRGPTSLNADWRRKELFRITMDNHKLLERLENLRPYYDTQKMERDHAEHHRHMVNSSHSARKQGLYDDLIPKYRFPRPILKPLAGRGSRSLPALEEAEAPPAPPPPSLPKPKKKKRPPQPPSPQEEEMEALEDVQQQAFLTEHPNRQGPPPAPAPALAAAPAPAATGAGYPPKQSAGSKAAPAAASSSSTPPQALPGSVEDSLAPVPAEEELPVSPPESPLKLEGGGVSPVQEEFQEDEAIVDSMEEYPAQEGETAPSPQDDSGGLEQQPNQETAPPPEGDQVEETQQSFEEEDVPSAADEGTAGESLDAASGAAEAAAPVDEEVAEAPFEEPLEEEPVANEGAAAETSQAEEDMTYEGEEFDMPSPAPPAGQDDAAAGEKVRNSLQLGVLEGLEQSPESPAPAAAGGSAEVGSSDAAAAKDDAAAGESVRDSVLESVVVPAETAPQAEDETYEEDEFEAPDD